MKKVTTIDIARRLGVSPATVSLAMNNDPRVSGETKRKVQELASELNYTPNSLATSLRTRKTKIIGLVLPSIANPFYPAIAWGVDNACAKAGYTVFVCNTFYDSERENQQILALIRKQVDGIIFIVSKWSKDLAELEFVKELKESGIKAVCLNRRVKLSWLDTISTDNFYGGYLATKHLLDLGHRNIAYLEGFSSNRRLGYEKALKEAGIQVEPELIYQLSGLEEEDERSYLAIRDFLKKHPEVTAIFANNDMAATGAFRAIKERGMQIPKAISVIGYDDFPFARLTDPPLTTVWQPTFEIGAQAAELLLNKINHPENQEKQEIIHTPQLVIRESTGPCINKLFKY